MAAIKDEEDLIEAMRDYFKSNLKTYIEAINTEKADFEIDPLDQDENFLINYEIFDLPNVDYISFGFEPEISEDSNEELSAQEVTILVDAMIYRDGSSNEGKKALRYMRALRSCALAFGNSQECIDDLSILRNTPVTIEVDGKQIVTSGIVVSISIA